MQNIQQNKPNKQTNMTKARQIKSKRNKPIITYLQTKQNETSIYPSYVATYYYKQNKRKTGIAKIKGAKQRRQTNTTL